MTSNVLMASINGRYGIRGIGAGWFGFYRLRSVNLCMSRRAFYIVNGITIYRVATVPLLVYLIFRHEPVAFRWLLAVSFLTDAIDGYLARKYKVVSKAGATLDSIGDDLTVLVAIIGMVVVNPAFFRQQWIAVSVLAVLYLFQAGAAFFKYGRLTSFHTWLAKIAAILHGSFLILFFFLGEPPIPLFFAAAVATCLDLIEEIVMVFLLPEWQADVRGLYILFKKKRG